MFFVVLFVYLAIYYIRPNEWVVGIIGFPLLKIVGIFSLLFLIYCAISGSRTKLYQGSSERYFYGFYFSILMSHISQFYFLGTVNSFNRFLPVIVGFLLVLTCINSRSQFNLFIVFMIMLTSYLAYEGCLQFNTGFSHGGLEPIYQHSRNIVGEVTKIVRIRWYGVFNDPNDLGLSLVLVIPFLLNMLLQRQIIFPILTLPLISSAIYFTNSRGTILAGLVTVFTYFVIRYRSLKGVVFGASGAIILFLFGPSRMATISADESSAYGRIESWYAAYQMFKSHPFFGVGHGMYTDYHYLVAHNSFVHVMAELGFLGLFFFVGLFYLAYNWLWLRVFKGSQGIISSSDLGLISASYASLTGILIAMFFLSRAYVLVPYISLALAIAISRVIDNEYSEIFKNHSSIQEGSSPRHLKNTFIFTCLVIFGINVVVKITI